MTVTQLAMHNAAAPTCPPGRRIQGSCPYIRPY
jgi:hypothetical protein